MIWSFYIKKKMQIKLIRGTVMYSNWSRPGVSNIRPAGWIRPTRGSSSARRMTLLSVKITERHKLHFYKSSCLLS